MVHGLRSTGQGLIWVVLAFLAGGCAASSPPAAPLSPATISPNQAFVTSIQSEVERVRPGGAALGLPPGDRADIQTKDQINVKGTGRAFLEFPQEVELELVRGTQVQVDGFQTAPQGSVVVRLKQIEGHTFTQLASLQHVQITVETDYARITPLTDNTQFLVCQAPGALTCVVAVNGAAQVEAQNKTVALKTGEGTFITPGQPPHVPFCADLRQIRDWWSRMRGTEETSDLGSMVVGWLQHPCGTAAPSEAAGTASPTATSTTATAQPVVGATSTPSGGTPAPLAQPASPNATASAVPAPVASSAPAGTGRLPASDGMVQIQQGSYVVGSSTPDDFHVAGREAKLSSYWIDAYLVTNAQYKAFLDSTGRAAPSAWRGGTFPAGREKYPATGLAWEDAAAYCAWANKRLPAEAEWEVAGRGSVADPPLYPWGSDPTAGGQASDLPNLDTYEVGTVPFNRSASGVYDLIGTVWQWVGEPYAPVPQGFKILRGGRYGLLEDLAYRQPARADDARFTRLAGVRCAADRVQERK